MTVLNAIQRASAMLGIDYPRTVYSVSDRAEIEFAVIAQEAADDIADRHKWSVLKRRQSYTGNGVIEGFSMPSDYASLATATGVLSTRLSAPLTFIPDETEWLDRTVINPIGGWGDYTMIGGEMLFNPVLSNGEVATFYYMTKNIVLTEDGTDQPQFLDDTDVFRLSERLLYLAIVWRWKAQKGLPYGEEMASFERALEQEIANDEGPRLIRGGGNTLPLGRIGYRGRIVT